MVRRSPLLSLALAALAALAVGPLCGRALAAGPVPGVNISVVQPPLSAGLMAELGASGVRSARLFMGAGLSGPTGTPSDYDGLVAQLALAGVKPLFVVYSDPSHPPTTKAGIRRYANYIRGAARRFRGRVIGWEIWNEEDSPSWWAGQPAVDGVRRNAGPYVRLLSAAYKAVKSVDRHVPVVLGGLTGNDYRFLSSVYRHGGRRWFDAVGTHTDIACGLSSPYTYYRDPGGAVSQWSFLGFRSVRAVMVHHGDARKPIWMTELGWSTAGGSCPYGRFAGQKAAGVSQSEQATYLSQAFHCLAQAPYVQRALVFRLEDGPQDSADERFGLLNANDTPKPAFAALAAYAHRGDTLSGGCGDFSPPSLRVAAPLPGHRFPKYLPISATATDPSGVRRIQLTYDGGHRIVSCWNHGSGPTFTCALHWMRAHHLPPGRHRITIRAFDTMGNSRARTVSVVKVG